MFSCSAENGQAGAVEGIDPTAPRQSGGRARPAIESIDVRTWRKLHVSR